MPSKATYRVCPKGHRYKKSSDCPVCPKCEALEKPVSTFLVALAAPARRALESAGIKTLKKLSTFTEEQILSLHGMGKSSLPQLRQQLKANQLDFKKAKPTNATKKGDEEWLRKLCLALPNTSEQPHFEKTSFRVGKKIFASFDVKNNKACFKLPATEQDIFSQAAGGFIYPIPNKWGQQGWTFAELDKADKRVVKQMIEVAYKEISDPKKK